MKNIPHGLTEVFVKFWSAAVYHTEGWAKAEMYRSTDFCVFVFCVGLTDSEINID